MTSTLYISILLFQVFFPLTHICVQLPSRKIKDLFKDIRISNFIFLSMFTNEIISTATRKKNRIKYAYTVIFFSYKIELKLILLDAEDDDESDGSVCSSRCVFLCSFKWTSCVKRAEHE
jgi:hypothetical protein